MARHSSPNDGDFAETDSAEDPLARDALAEDDLAEDDLAEDDLAEDDLAEGRPGNARSEPEVADFGMPGFDLSRLEALTLEIGSHLEPSEVSRSIAVGLTKAVRAAAVRLWRAREGRLELAASAGPPGADSPPERVLRAAESGRARATNELARDGSTGPADWTMLHGLRSVAILPATFRDQSLGVLAVWWTVPLAEPALEPLERFARAAAVALRNSQRYAEVEATARHLEAENRSLYDVVPEPVDCGGIVGRSDAIRRVLEQIDLVAGTDAAVLLQGETGTGKELIARTIHERSRRSDRPMVKVNCGAIASGLVESELFGHEKGAFTGALERRIGRFELADGGTLFLDEVAELPPETQVKLLRALQEQEFERVGSSRSIRVDVRIIAAGNRNLAAEVEAGRFRSDLFYRLNVFPIRIPPLRERGDDASLIAACALPVIARQLGKEIGELSVGAREALDAFPWPGNVRQMLNVVQRALIVAQGPFLEAEDLGLSERSLSAAQGAPIDEPSRRGPSPGTGEAQASSTLSLPTLRQVEREHIERVLEHTGWVVEGPRGAALVLDLHPNTLRSRMTRLGIRRPGADAGPAPGSASLPAAAHRAADRGV